jgi:hypothetical protein
VSGTAESAEGHGLAFVSDGRDDNFILQRMQQLLRNFGSDLADRRRAAILVSLAAL